MTIKCESCGTSFFVPNTLAGKRVKCRKCGQAVAVGAPPPPAAAKPLFKPKAPLAAAAPAPAAPGASPLAILCIFSTAALISFPRSRHS